MLFEYAGAECNGPQAGVVSQRMVTQTDYRVGEVVSQLCQGAEADLLEAAVDKALQSTRTGDIMTPGCTETGTDGMTAAVLDAMDRLAR